MRILFLVTGTVLLGACGPADPDEAGRAAVFELQGPGPQSPLRGETRTVSGIVSGDFQDGDADERQDSGGFFLQAPAADDDPRTSDGVFVADPDDAAVDVRYGDIVTVTGTVREFFGETRLDAHSVAITGSAEPRVTELTLPAAAVMQSADGAPLADLERYEGMLVRLPQTVYVQDLYTLERFGDLLLGLQARIPQFTAVHEPDRAGFRAHRERVAAQSLWLDDGRDEQNVAPVRYNDAAGLPGRSPRVGDAVTGLQGVLRYGRGSGSRGAAGWRLLPTVAPRFEVRNPRPGVPDTGGRLVIAGFNVLNFFTTIDAAGVRCGPAGDAGCRGADSARELARQRAKLVNAIARLNADVVGLMELENNRRAAVQSLVTGLNDTAPLADWQWIDTGTLGGDAIRVAIIYRATAVEPLGPHAVLDSGVDARFDDTRNRPALAQGFRERQSGERFTLAVNHLKSKGSSCAADGDPDRGDGQGNCNATRARAAAALADWLAGDPTASGDKDVLVIGDLNAYMKEDPLRVLEAAGYVNLLAAQAGESAYTFVYRGRSGALDHALASASLAPQISAVTAWHSNADEAPLNDYNLEFGRDPALFDADTPWRASDHDPLLIGLRLAAGPSGSAVAVGPGECQANRLQERCVTGGAIEKQ